MSSFSAAHREKNRREEYSIFDGQWHDKLHMIQFESVKCSGSAVQGIVKL